MTTRLPRPDAASLWPGPERWDHVRSAAREAPATGTPAGAVPCADASDIAAAVEKARTASASSPLKDDIPTRLAALDALITGITARREDFAQAISAEMGSPIDFARDKQVTAALGHLEATRDALTNAPDRTEAAPGHWTRHEPLGVAALITPWNWPLNQVALKLGGALGAGCAVLLKPSELAPLSTSILAQIIDAAGLAGQVQIVMGDGLTGQALVEADVDVISFTGSTGVGRKIAARAGQDLKPAVMELGGKSPNLLFDDCDVALAVTQGVAHCFRNSGQSCNAASRMLVQRGTYAEVIQLAKAQAEQAVFADPGQPGDHFGPLVSRAQLARVDALIAQSIAEGARLVTGGVSGHMQGGFFPRPTVFADVTPDMALFTTEAFGPVLSITPFETEADAIALANHGPYGLAGYVQTGDPARAARVAEALEVGMVQVNGQSRVAGAPFGGRGASGYGREAGLWGIRAFQTVKSVSGAR
ncbi:aldehyde dehydrogenase family protein [Pseudaestuariivita sp.]|uniref:aldehyde dehydrogenase family protein n=1 Tax=Pseudaestuariivita sp. TaxID=2211669 RepID=UPI0040594316